MKKEIKGVQKYRLKMEKDGDLIKYSEKINGADKAFELLSKAGLDMEPEEVFVLICMDAKLVPIAYFECARGILDSTVASPRELIKRALLTNCHSVLIAHNHPSGNTTPSHEDEKVTSKLIRSFSTVGLPLRDHIIVGPDAKPYSFARSEEFGYQFSLQ